jgi:hypothetical protein
VVVKVNLEEICGAAKHLEASETLRENGRMYLILSWVVSSYLRFKIEATGILEDEDEGTKGGLSKDSIGNKVTLLAAGLLLSFTENNTWTRRQG